jgi:hypothetical protein
VAGRQASVRANPHEWGCVMRAACECGSLEAFEILVRAGLPIDEPLTPYAVYPYDVTGWTPIMFAMISAWPGSSLIVRRLRELGAEQVDMLTTTARNYFESG